MNDAMLSKLHNTAEEFGNIARMVNESSKKRKDNSRKAIEFIDKSLEIGEKLYNDFRMVAESNIRLRDQDTFVLNTCLNLNTNIEKQKQLIKTLEGKNAFTPDIKKNIEKIVTDFSQVIEEAQQNINSIVSADNDIILLDKILVTRKEFQQESLKKLEKLASISLEDAEKAIIGSSSNLQRGLSMVEKYKKVGEHIQKKDTTILNTLVDEAATGWSIAADVNKSSRSQFEFAEKVNQFTGELHEDSISIMELVDKKHQIFEQNLQTITVLTVSISMLFKNYLAMEEIIENIEYNETTRSIFNSLHSLVKIACEDIRTISALNYDMTDSIHLNNETETKAVTLSKKELEYYKDIKIAVEVMTEATKYPVEGSAKNINNGKILEEELKKIIAAL
ncbi:MAG TPA: hypothetical protein PK926_12565 [Spirochaetota bacterium]|nr:hypothetical protein [Spirochaetota bacterium]HPI89211.1 hypothetical protein [Spirochaetota bacterium]HPR48972.1 hypothetical protein [Spirochaetota bacterium]